MAAAANKKRPETTSATAKSATAILLPMLDEAKSRDAKSMANIGVIGQPESDSFYQIHVLVLFLFGTNRSDSA